MRRTYTRKEIAAANDLSHETIRRRERRIGLDQCRDRTSDHPVRYHRERAARVLRQNGYQIPND